MRSVVPDDYCNCAERQFRLRRHKPQRKTLKGMQRIDHLARRLAIELDFPKAFRHRCEDDLAFHPGDILTNAHMRPITESQVTDRVAIEVEHIGLLPFTWVAIR